MLTDYIILHYLPY